MRPVFVGPTRFAAAALCLVAATLMQCKGGVKQEKKTATTEGAAQSLEEERVDDVDCPSGRTVREPAPDSPEAVVLRLYVAALRPDDETAFEAFFAEFSPKHDKEWVRKQYWPRVRQHVAKYVPDPQQPTYRICREETIDGGQKFYIRSSDPLKSHPPILLKQVDGKWKVDFFTY